MAPIGRIASSLVLPAALAAVLVASGLNAFADEKKPATPDPTVGAPGPDCLELYQIDHTEVIDDNTILFHMKGKTDYVSKLPFRCHGLKFEDGFAYATSINKLCGKVDTIKVLRRGNVCPLGPFYHYIKPAKPGKDAVKGQMPASPPASPKAAEPEQSPE